MAKRVTYHVTPRDEGEWAVKKSGAQKASEVFENKEDAVDKAKDLAKSNPCGQVIIHRKDGIIQTEHTYGKDPYPPKG